MATPSIPEPTRLVLAGLAGHSSASASAVADLLGLPSVSFATDPYVTCLDLGGSGAVFTHSRHRVVQLVGEEAKAIKRKITSVLSIRRSATPRRSWRKPAHASRPARKAELHYRSRQKST